MIEEEGDLLYLAGGGIAALLLGMVLYPAREITVASNFAFLFLILTIGIAEFGGKRAAVVTALVSALSLDFFLTRPYLTLAIAGKNDLIAFLGLAACGLVAAAFGTRMRRKTADLGAARGHVGLLHDTLHYLAVTGPMEPVLFRVLEEARAALPVSALVARDERGRVLAVSGEGPETRVPAQELEPDTLLPHGAPARGLPPEGLPLPAEGGRLPLVIGNRRVGWLDFWGSGAPADAEVREALSDLGRLAAVWLGSSAGGSVGPDSKPVSAPRS